MIPVLCETRAQTFWHQDSDAIGLMLWVHSPPLQAISLLFSHSHFPVGESLWCLPCWNPSAVFSFVLFLFFIFHTLTVIMTLSWLYRLNFSRALLCIHLLLPVSLPSLSSFFISICAPSCGHSLYLSTCVCIFKVHTRCTSSTKLFVKPVHLHLLLHKLLSSKPPALFAYLWNSFFFLPDNICKNNNFINIG